MCFCCIVTAPLLQGVQNPVLITKSETEKKELISGKNYSTNCLNAKGERSFSTKIDSTNGPQRLWFDRRIFEQVSK